MVMAREHASNSVPRRCASVRRRVVCVERELPLHVIEEQPLVQTRARTVPDTRSAAILGPQ
jgi:hypothetical protein